MTFYYEILRNKMGKWTEQEIEVLKRDYSMIESKVIANFLNKTRDAVFSKAYSLGLRKDRMFLVKSAERLKNGGKAYRFKKGHIPANKGKKQIDFMSIEAIERTKATRFQIGNIPYNSKEDGYRTKKKDGRGIIYQWIKKEGKLQPYHIWLWESINGEIPKGHIITFKDKDTSNIVIENLECISKQENMLRNSYHNYPKDLKETIRKLNKIKRKIKNLEK